MENEKNHFYLSALIIIVGFFCLFILIIIPTNDLKISGMVAKEKNVYCEDLTPLNKCSLDSIGNKCVMSKQGPRLEMSIDCY
jgi:hypothetical protein